MSCSRVGEVVVVSIVVVVVVVVVVVSRAGKWRREVLGHTYIHTYIHVGGRVENHTAQDD